MNYEYCQSGNKIIVTLATLTLVQKLNQHE